MAATRITLSHARIRAPLSFACHNHFSTNLGFSDEPTELMNIIKPKFQHISECYVGWTVIVRGIQKKECEKLAARISQLIMHFHQTCTHTRRSALFHRMLFRLCGHISYMQFVRLMPFHIYWNVVEFNVYSFSHSIDAPVWNGAECTLTSHQLKRTPSTPQHVHKFCGHMAFFSLLFKCSEFSSLFLLVDVSLVHFA